MYQPKHVFRRRLNTEHHVLRLETCNGARGRSKHSVHSKSNSCHRVLCKDAGGKPLTAASHVLMQYMTTPVVRRQASCWIRCAPHSSLVGCPSLWYAVCHSGRLSVTLVSCLSLGYAVCHSVMLPIILLHTNFFAQPVF